MSVLLLIERRRTGRGPKIPLRSAYTRVRVEGLAEGDGLGIECSHGLITLYGNGVTELPTKLERGELVCGHLIGEGSCVTLQLEE